MEKILPLTTSEQEEVLEHNDKRFPVREFIDTYDHFPKRCFPAHWHPEFELHLVLRGEISFQVEDMKHTVKAGQAIYIAPNIVHSAHALTGNSSSYNVIVLPELLVGVLNAINCLEDSQPLTSSSPSFFVLDSPERREDYYISEALRTMYYSNTTSQTQLFILSHLLEIWRDLLLIFPPQESSSEGMRNALQSERMKTMIEYIHRFYAQPVTVNSIAESASISKSECFRCFATFSDMTPLEYLNNYRLLQACRLLLDTSDSMTDICFKTGFNNTSYFAKKFKAQYGMTPKEYRSAHLTSF